MAVAVSRPMPGIEQQRGARRGLAGQLGQLALQLGDARLQQADFLDQQAIGAADQRRHGGMRIGQHAADLLDARCGCHRRWRCRTRGRSRAAH